MNAIKQLNPYFPVAITDESELTEGRKIVIVNSHLHMARVSVIVKAPYITEWGEEAIDVHVSSHVYSDLITYCYLTDFGVKEYDGRYRTGWNRLNWIVAADKLGDDIPDVNDYSKYRHDQLEELLFERIGALRV
jgi:hypothetical protein